MSPAGAGALVATVLLMVATLEAQGPRLPFGLQPGRRGVGVRDFTLDGRVSTAWYPARCERRPAAPVRPCRDAMPDSGRFPLLVLGTSERAGEDTVRGIYFASHGYAVVLGRASDALAGGREWSLVDTTQVVVAGAGGAVVAGARARVEFDPAVAADAGPVGGGMPELFWGPVADRSGGSRAFVEFPPGSSNHVRLVTAVSHAFLDAALGRGRHTVSELLLRLRRAGLVVCCPSPG